MIKILLASIVLASAGCGFSPPTHYYSLTPIQSIQPINGSGPPLQVLHVTIPAALDRESLVEWTGSGELKISGRNRWAAPLDEMIQNVLAADLRHKLPGRVFLPGDPVPPGRSLGLLINVANFAAADSERVVLAADWSLMSGRPALPLLTRSELIKIPIGTSRSSEVVYAMSEALAVLSDRIAHAIVAEDEHTQVPRLASAESM
jgi:uncharacterized protein